MSEVGIFPRGRRGTVQAGADVFQSLFPQEVAFPFDRQHSHFELFGKFPKQILVCVLSLFAS